MSTKKPHPSTASACLAALVASDAAAPRLTSIRSDDRIDLSAATLVNWVAKATHMLTDDVGVGPGDRLAMGMPRHWLAAVWLLAADAVGACVELVDADLAGVDSLDVAAVLVASAHGAASAPPTAEVFVASLRPFGLPLDPPPKPPLRDFVDEVRAYPDHLGQIADDPDLEYLVVDGQSVTRRESLDKARQTAVDQGWPSGARVLSTGPLTPASIIEGLLGPWTVDGSAVWLGNQTDGLDVFVCEQERVSHRLG